MSTMYEIPMLNPDYYDWGFWRNKLEGFLYLPYVAQGVLTMFWHIHLIWIFSIGGRREDGFPQVAFESFGS